MKFGNALKVEKKVISGAALAGSLTTFFSLFVATGSESVVLFVFLEPVVLSCVMPFFVRYHTDSATPANASLRIIAGAVVFAAFLTVGALVVCLLRGVSAEPFLSTLFFLPFAIFVASITVTFSLLISVHLGQIAGATVATLIIATPFYISHVLGVAPPAVRLFVAQAAVSVNPIAVASSSILHFDWLRSPRMYALCPIGGEQYPFYYPSCLKVAMVYLLCGLLVLGAGHLLARRKIRGIESRTGIGE